MKLLKLMWMSVVGLMFAACTQEGSNSLMAEEEEKEGLTSPTEYVVSFAFTGEIGVSQEPLTKGVGDPATDSICGINIYYKKDGQAEAVYGYGLFDDMRSASVTLLSGYTYRFVCSVVKNGKETLYKESSGGVDSYAYPFQTGTSPITTEVKNEFVLESSSSLIGLASGSAHLADVDPPTNDNAEKYAPGIERYYGETEITPTTDGTVTINLKRVFFGAKFVISGIDDGGGGTLTVTCKDDDDVELWTKTVTEDCEFDPIFYSFSDLKDCWDADEDFGW
jgi:hypothetical protein